MTKHRTGTLVRLTLDITVRSQTILTMPGADIPDTRVDATDVGGELRYGR
jgi:hypothetical protein